MEQITSKTTPWSGKCNKVLIFLVIILLLLSPSAFAEKLAWRCSFAGPYEPIIEWDEGVFLEVAAVIFYDIAEYKCDLVSYCSETYTEEESKAFCKVADKKTVWDYTQEAPPPGEFYGTFKVTAETSISCDDLPAHYYGPYKSKKPAIFRFKDCSAFDKALEDAKEDVEKACKEGGSIPNEKDVCYDLWDKMDTVKQTLDKMEKEVAPLEQELSYLKEKLGKMESEYALVKAKYDGQLNKIGLKRKILDGESEKLLTYKEAFVAELIDGVASSAGHFGHIWELHKFLYTGEFKYLALAGTGPLGAIKSLKTIGPLGGSIISGGLAIKSIEEAGIKIDTAQKDYETAQVEFDVALALFNDWLKTQDGLQTLMLMNQFETQIPPLKSKIRELQEVVDYKNKIVANLREMYEARKAAYEECLEKEKAKREAAEKESSKACEDAKAREKAASDKLEECRNA